MILRPAINFIMPTGGSGVTSCFCMEPFNKHLKVTTCNDRDNKATINQGAVSLQLTCISGNRARVSWRNSTPFTYLLKKWSLATDMVLTLVLQLPKRALLASLEAFAREQIMSSQMFDSNIQEKSLPFSLTYRFRTKKVLIYLVDSHHILVLVLLYIIFIFMLSTLCRCWVASCI